MSNAWKILVLAAREGDLRPFRQELANAQRAAELILVRNVGEIVKQFEVGGFDAVILTATISHLHLAQALAEIRARDPVLPVLLVVRSADAGPFLAVVRSGVSTVLFTEVLSLLDATLDRELHLAEICRDMRRREQRSHLLTAAAEASPQALAVADREGMLRWANAAYRRLAGVTLPEIEAGTTSMWGAEAGPMPEAWRALQVGNLWRGTVPGPQSENGTALHRLAVDVFHLPGDDRPWYVIARHEPGATETAPAPLGTAAQRADLFAAIAGGIAHDLNNILAPVTMAANLLREQELTPEGAGLLDTIEQSAERGAAVIKQVLTFARGSENCAMLLQPRLVVSEVARLAAEVFPSNIGVRADIPAELWPIVGDPAEINQALVNVLVNARDALAEGGHVELVARNVTVSKMLDTPFFSAQPGDYVEITVDDTGPGMEPEVASRAWEPFVTTKGAGQGAGLGLSRVAGVLRSHGGFAQLQTRTGHGTTVKLYFPRAPGEPGRTAEVEETLPATSGKILVVDDEPTILDLSRRILERAGYDVLVASDGREALGVFARHRSEISIVLTDLAMPGMNGFTLVWALRRSKPDLHVVVATGHGTQANLRELERMGVRRVLLKPFNAPRLLEAVGLTLAEPVRCEPDLFLGEIAANGA